MILWEKQEVKQISFDKKNVLLDTIVTEQIRSLSDGSILGNR